MFTLKLYQNGPSPSSRTVILQTVGVWIDQCAGGVKQLVAFKNEVGVTPSDVFYVGGEVQPDQDAIETGVGGNYYDWGVLENQHGKTTEVFR